MSNGDSVTLGSGFFCGLCKRPLGQFETIFYRNSVCLCGLCVEKHDAEITAIRFGGEEYDRLKRIEAAAKEAHGELERLTLYRQLVSPITYEVRDKLHKALEGK